MLLLSFYQLGEGTEHLLFYIYINLVYAEIAWFDYCINLIFQMKIDEEQLFWGTNREMQFFLHFILVHFWTYMLNPV